MKNEKRYKITRKSKPFKRIKKIQKGRKKAKNVQEVETLAYPRRGRNVIFRGKGEIWFSGWHIQPCKVDNR